MSEDVKVYHVETQKDYDDLMIKLEDEWYKWFSGKKPTDINGWVGEETVIYLNESRDYRLTYGYISTARENYSDVRIIKHKAKGVEQMEKVVVPQFVADYIEGHYQGLKPGNWDKADLIRAWDDYIEGYGCSDLRKWIKNDGNFLKLVMAIATNEYEVEEKKYYWRKKKEYSFTFENQRSDNYLKLDVESRLFFSDKVEFGFSTTKFTETEVRKLVGEEDFKKLERVKITD